MAKLYDVAVLGDTPAGNAAAAVLCKAKRSVTVVSSPVGMVMHCPLAEWVPAFLFDRLGKAGLGKTLARQAGATPFFRVLYHDAALERSAEYKRKPPAGYFLPAGALAELLHGLAGRAGANHRTSKHAPAIELHEDDIELLGTRRCRAKMLLVAQDSPTHTLAELGRPVRLAPASPMLSVGLDIPLNGKPGPDDEALHIVEMAERSELAMFFTVAGVVHLRVLSTSRAAGNRTAELTALLARLRETNLLPEKLSLGKTRGAVWHPPAGAALEQETHEAKRTLLIGSAGGFAESTTGQSLAPSVQSGLLAAKLLGEALDGGKPQEKLMEFRDRWRKELADYLRPPNTAVSMLLPLMFLNPRIVPKLTAALLWGEDV